MVEIFVNRNNANKWDFFRFVNVNFIFIVNGLVVHFEGMLIFAVYFFYF